MSRSMEITHPEKPCQRNKKLAFYVNIQDITFKDGKDLPC